MAKTYYTVDDLSVGDILTETVMDESRINMSNLIVPPMVRAVRSTNQAISHDTSTAIQFNATDDFDTDAMHDTVTNNTRITFNTAGVYLLVADVQYTAASDNEQSITIRADGSTSIDSIGHGDVLKNLNLTAIYEFSAAQYVELLTYQNNSGAGARNVTAAFSAVWQGRTTAP